MAISPKPSRPRSQQAGIDKRDRVQSESRSDVERANSRHGLIRCDREKLAERIGDGRRDAAGGKSDKCIVQFSFSRALKGGRFFKLIREW